MGGHTFKRKAPFATTSFKKGEWAYFRGWAYFERLQYNTMSAVSMVAPLKKGGCSCRHAVHNIQYTSKIQTQVKSLVKKWLQLSRSSVLGMSPLPP